MLAKQLSVFIENRQGRLHEVLEVLKINGVNILSLSLADTTEYGLLRLIVNDPDLGKEKLSEAGFSIMMTDILVIKIEHKAGSLQTLLQTMSAKGINIEYMYGLSVDGEVITDATMQIEKDKLVEGLLFKKGKKNYLLIKIK